MNLTDVDLDAGVGGVQPLRAPKRFQRVRGAAARARQEPEDVVCLWSAWQGGADALELAARFVGLAGVEEGDSEIQLGDGQRVVLGERTPERRRGGVEVVLLEVGDADVVGPVGGFARGARVLGRVPHRRTACRRQQQRARRQHERSGNHFTTWRASGSVARAVTPLPSSIVSDWFAGAPGNSSTRPFGHLTSILVTAATGPRPNVNGSSLCEQ